MAGERVGRGIIAVALLLSGAGAAWGQSTPAPFAEPWPAPTVLKTSFAEDGGAQDWRFAFHGYARMALRVHDSPWGSRPPYLIDDRYFESGFAYTRVNEGSWAELQLSAEKGRSRFVAGLFASELSDWSQPKVEQFGFATAFVEHTFLPVDELSLRLRAGMFWDRMGYFGAYDTYLFGRTHLAGASVEARLFEQGYLRLGYGAHQKVANQGFSPLGWAVVGYALDWLDVGVYTLKSWTEDSDYEFGELSAANASFRVIGVEAQVAVPYTGRAHVGVARYDADKVQHLGDGIEVLHAQGGQKLTTNYFGDAETGTGEMLVVAGELTWQPHRTLDAVVERAVARKVEGLDLSLFFMAAQVASKHPALAQAQAQDPDPESTSRTYFKWGTELFYRPVGLGVPQPFAALRYDRVVLDADHDSLGFRVVTPRLGVTPTEGLDVFASLSFYDYGENIVATEEAQIARGDGTAPDDRVFKLQAQARW